MNAIFASQFRLRLRRVKLNLKSTLVSDLSPLAGLSALTELNLIGTQVSDLSPLAGLSGLTTLDIRHTKVSDLSPLAGLKNLKVIYLAKDQEMLIPDSLTKVVMRL